jgi:hypothetical protein
MYEHLSTQQLSDLVEGLIPPQERELLEAHLAGCQECRRALARREETMERMRQGLPAYLEAVTPPPALRWENIRDRVPHKRESGWRKTMWRPIRSATAALLVLAALIGLVVGLTFVFRQVAEPARPADDQAAPGPVLELSGRLPPGTGPFGFQALSITLRAELPAIPEQVPLVEVEPVLEGASAETLRLWAERLGIGPVKLYQRSVPYREGDVDLTAIDSEYAFLSISPPVLHYSERDRYARMYAFGAVALRGEAMDEAGARAAAAAFVDRLAPYLVTVEGMEPQPEIDFELRAMEEPSAAWTGERRYEVIPMVGGVALELDGTLENTLLVGPGGEVTWAMLTPVRLTLTGETVQPRPPEPVVRDLLAGERGVLRGSGWNTQDSGPDQGIQTYNRGLSLEAGEVLDLVGWIDTLESVDGGADLVLLHALNRKGMFVLDGAELEGGSDVPVYRVVGRVSETEAPSVWRVAVERLEVVQALSYSWEGQAERRPDGLWLRTRDGREYLLPDGPDEVPDGVAIGVLGVEDKTPGQLDWGTIMVLPESEVGGGGAAESQESVAGAAEPVGAAPTPFPATAMPRGEGVAPTTPTPVPNGMAVESAVVVAQPAPDPAMAQDTPPDWWDHQPGDTVTVEGVLYLRGYVLPDGQRQIFGSMTVQGPAGAEMPYLPLVGERLPELLQLDQLHVRARGEIMDAQESEAESALPQFPAPFGQVLYVEAVEQLWPDEVKGVYSGLARMERVAGEEVALLADERSGETVALPADTVRSLLGPEPEGETVLSLVGVREPGATIGAYPLLRIVELRMGDSGVSDLEKQLESPLVEMGAGEAGPSAVIVDELRLAYRVVYAPPSGMEAGTAPDFTSAELVYLLRGRSPDGRYVVNLRLDPLQPVEQP